VIFFFTKIYGVDLLGTSGYYVIVKAFLPKSNKTSA